MVIIKPSMIEKILEDAPSITGSEGDADIFVNVVNDSWGKSLVCQNQHLAMGVFRAVENKIPSVRCASTGQTCYVSAYGKVENLIEPFAESYGYYKVPVYEVKETTVFSVIGNFFSVLILI